MFPVQEVLPAVQRVLGTCDETEVYERINAAVEILCTEADWDPTVGWVDVAVDTDRELTLPRHVESILAVNIGGRPSLGHDKWFQYHLNGPGIDCRVRDDSWTDVGVFTTITEPTEPFELVAYLDSAADNNAALRVYAIDENDRRIFSVEGGVTVEGFLVPTVYGTPVPNPDAPKIKSIYRITKPVTKGFVRLETLDGTRIGFYEPTETEPQYRRLRLGHSCTWARIQYKKRVFKLIKADDLVPLHATTALPLMCKALKKFDEDRVDDGTKYYAMAVGLLKKKQLSIDPPTGPSIQVANRNLLADRRDRLDG